MTTTQHDGLYEEGTARSLEESERLSIEYWTGDVRNLDPKRRFDVATATHYLHYLERKD